ncbi:MAG: DEAD/DEAH box helicase [Parachlamydiaceae bacterium]|nr:DEAD/DEAH box helicase [Parachlamydiaceae bacterium]
MLNFRKLKRDYSSNVLKEGKESYDKKMILSAKIAKLDPRSVRFCCKVMGSFDHAYQCEIEIDRIGSSTMDSDCDCSYKYDCQHLAAVLFYLEEHFDALLIAYSKENSIDQEPHIDEKEKENLRKTIKEAESKEKVRRGIKCQKELLEEYVSSSCVLGQSPFFHFEEDPACDPAELAVILMNPFPQAQNNLVYNPEVQLALRLPYRSKPLNIPNVKEFLDAVRYCEPFYIGSKHYFFLLDSFDEESRSILKLILDNAYFVESNDEPNLRIAQFDSEAFGAILAHAHEMAMARKHTRVPKDELETSYAPMSCIYHLSLEEPLRFSPTPCHLNFDLEYLNAVAPKILLSPSIMLGNQQKVELVEARFFACAQPGMIFEKVYYRFPQAIRRKHLRNIHVIREITIPEPLFGTFVENSLPELMHYAEVSNREIIEEFVTLPFVGKLTAACDINYLDGELEASLTFIYDKIKVPAAASQLTIAHITPFVTSQGILARNLTEEQRIIKDLFQGFDLDGQGAVYTAKSDKKIVEFMTEVIPRNQHFVHFNCPQNLLEQFVYDDTQFVLSLKETERIDFYEVDLKVKGHLKGVSFNMLWECLASRRAFIELSRTKPSKKKNSQEGIKSHKILALDLDTLAKTLQLFDEIGISELTDHIERRPLWSLSSLHPEQFEGLPIEFSMSDKLKKIQQQMLGNHSMVPAPIPDLIQAKLRTYQIDGVSWLERLRSMHLNGILADDMGLGKTLQAIIAITQHMENNPNAKTLVVCPTSLVYNWKEELKKFNPKLAALPVDGTPAQRKKLLSSFAKFDVVIISYSLLQKDIEFYKTIMFDYVILDEAQHIKNRSTRNAKSVKMIQAMHRLILTGTPIENSLDELWSLFDFLMPGLLSSYERFVEKYVRTSGQTLSTNMDILRKKVNPFILRRMKKDVLEDLPPISEIIYRCHLSDLQRELYQSYAKTAREELSQLVKKEGFDRIQIHVLATLTRLKQICCHPAIFAKDKPEAGDSIKYDLLLELLQTLIEGKHKTVVFSQYTRMLKIMVHDLEKLGIRFEYLDGSSKNRLDIVKRFNEDEQTSVFLLSLKAGGIGLNLTGADTVIHYDMWWNPAVESQATDRVHRFGQKRSVSACKLITLDTIEEKIMQLQERKKGINQQIISCDEDVIEKLTWEEVLELLQT